MLLIGECAQQRHEAELAAQWQEAEFAPQQRRPQQRRQEPEVAKEAEFAPAVAAEQGDANLNAKSRGQVGLVRRTEV